MDRCSLTHSTLTDSLTPSLTHFVHCLCLCLCLSVCACVQVHSLTPESSLQVQQKLGADLVVVLDECTPFHGEQ